MIRFFQERNLHNKEFELTEIAKALLLEVLPVDHRVCEFGDSGEKFYIILKGSVKVEIPETVKVPTKELEERRDRHKQLSEMID